jgi:hypothetical protein
VIETRTVITVANSQYWIIDRDLEPDIESVTYRDFNGLISAHASFAVVMTGTQFGLVQLTIASLNDEPRLSIDDWDDVVEISLTFEELGAVTTDNGLGLEQAPYLPPGDYRIRVHARGRDLGHDQADVWNSPIEEHLIQAWPGPKDREICHKLSDAYGASIRAR